LDERRLFCLSLFWGLVFFGRASPRYFVVVVVCWAPCVRTYSRFLSVSGVVLFTFPSLKSAGMKSARIGISGFAVIDRMHDCVLRIVCVVL
jgi:hypothetical protein